MHVSDVNNRTQSLSTTWRSGMYFSFLFWSLKISKFMHFQHDNFSVIYNECRLREPHFSHIQLNLVLNNIRHFVRIYLLNLTIGHNIQHCYVDYGWNAVNFFHPNFFSNDWCFLATEWTRVQNYRKNYEWT